MGSIIFALLLCWLLGACSAVRLAYNNAPDLTYWWIDGYLDFDDTQSPRVREALASLHRWHRQTELPLYIGLLQGLQGTALGDVTAAQACGLLETTRERLRAVVDRAEPSALALLPSLKPAQIEHIARQFDKRNRAWRQEWLEISPQAVRERRLSQNVSRLEMFYGTLEPAQLRILSQSTERSSYKPALNYQEALRRQHDGLQTLRQLTASNPGAAQTRAALRGLLERALKPPDAAMQRYFETLAGESCDALASVHNSTSAAQRQQMVEKLRNYEADLRALLTD